MTGRRHWLAAGAVLWLLVGCAGQAFHRDGLALLAEGRYEDAVAKLEEAKSKDPTDPKIRKDLLRARENGSNRFVTIGNNERGAEQFDRAEAAYRQALRIHPENARALNGLEAIAMDQRHIRIVAQAQELLSKGEGEGASTRLKEVFLENPNLGRALQLQRQINERAAKELTLVPLLRSNFRKPVTLQFRDANLKMVMESISKTSGINILLDKDVRADLKTTIFVTGTTVEDTLDLILMQNQLEKKVLSDNTIFIYPNTPAKLKDYQELKVRSFHLVNADVKQMQAMIKTILKTRDLFINEKTNSLIMRDTPEAIRLAENIIADQDIAEPEVMLEVEVLEVTHKRDSNLGIQFPNGLSVAPIGRDATGAPVIPGGTATGVILGSLGQLTRDRLLASPIPSLTINADLTDSDVNTLASPRIRVRHKEKAKVHIGDRLPVFSNAVTPVATGLPVVTGTVQYLEVGLKLEVEPDIHSDGEVGIKLSMEVSTADKTPTTNGSSTAYAIHTRNTTTVLRLKDGETQVLAGLIQDNESKGRIMVPGLGEVPVLGRLFSTHSDNKQKSEIVLSITPRLVGKTRLPNAQLIEFWTGTESNLRSSPLALRQVGAVSMPSGSTLPPARSTPLPTRSGPGAATTLAPASPISVNWQGPAQAKVGERFTVTLSAQAGQPVRNLHLLLGFDPVALKAVDAIEGTFLKQQNVPSNFTRDLNQSSGQISLQLVGSGDQGARGSGSVTAITFEVLAASDRSEISVIQMTPTGMSGEELSFAPTSAHAVKLDP